MAACQIPARVSVGMLVATGVMVLYMLRVNLSVAIVAMVRTPTTSTLNNSPEIKRSYCQKLDVVESSSVNISFDGYELLQNNITQVDNPTYEEDALAEQTDQLLLTGPQKGMVLGGFFYGYVITSIPGGRLAELYGTKIVFGGSILLSGILTLFTPVAARFSYVALILIRILIGIAQGVVYPSMHVLVARWIPPLERPRFISITYMGNCLGTIITLPMCGVIIDSLGWEAVFYICGAIAIVWIAFWCLLMFDSPSNHPRISEKEREYILESISDGTTKQKPNQTPWCAFMTSLPLWAINMAHVGGMFCFTLLLTQLPTYMDSVLGFSIRNNGLLSSLPFLAQFLGSTTCGCVGDYLLTRNYITRSTSRRIFATVSLVLPAIILVAVGYVGCNITWAVVLFPVSAGCLGAFGAGHLANHLDLAPNFAGTLLGLSNTIAFSISMLAPIIVGAMTPDQSLQQWQYVFWLNGVICIACLVFFMIFAKFEIQPWNYCMEEKIEKLAKEEEKKSFLGLPFRPNTLGKKRERETEGGVGDAEEHY
ncbi:sialin-like isoform X1 [Macrobrachium nipponense]|uniref:sialin-like isoform X1 n=1 Tax=Macrobrachium nipponense TaxID=159736 RepID=UPI0030C8C6BD